MMGDKCLDISEWVNDQLERLMDASDHIVELQHQIHLYHNLIDMRVSSALKSAPTKALQLEYASILYFEKTCSIGLLAKALNVVPDDLSDMFPPEPLLIGNVYECPECGDSMVGDDREYCDSCALCHLPYAEYLKTEHWQNIRAMALIRAGQRCQLCNANNLQLHVHHRTYENRGKETSDDVIVLCKTCHAKFHNKLDKVNS